MKRFSIGKLALYITVCMERTQPDGEMGKCMLASLPAAFLFTLTTLPLPPTIIQQQQPLQQQQQQQALRPVWCYIITQMVLFVSVSSTSTKTSVWWITAQFKMIFFLLKAWMRHCSVLKNPNTGRKILKQWLQQQQQHNNSRYINI